MGYCEKRRQVRQVTWDGDTKSEPVKIEPGGYFSIYLPAAFTGTQLTFESLEDDGTWTPIYFDNGTSSVALTSRVTNPGRNCLPSELLAGFDVIRLVSSASETVVGWLGLTE